MQGEEKNSLSRGKWKDEKQGRQEEKKKKEKKAALLFCVAEVVTRDIDSGQ